MALLRQVGGLAHDIVASLVYLGDEEGLRGGSLSVGLMVCALLLAQGDAVTDGHGVGGAYAAQAKVALDATLHLAPVVGAHDIGTAGVAHDDAVQRGLVVLVLCHRLRRS